MSVGYVVTSEYLVKLSRSERYIPIKQISCKLKSFHVLFADIMKFPVLLLLVRIFERGYIPYISFLKVARFAIIYFYIS